MAGMLENMNAAPAQSEAPPAAAVDDEEEPNVSPEEQAAYDEFVENGFNLIYEGGEARPAILEMLDEDPADLMAVLGEIEGMQAALTPTLALAATAVIVTLQVVRGYGDERPDGSVIMHGGRAILEDIANLAEVAGIHSYSQEEMNKAFFQAMDLYREAAASEGIIDLDALAGEFGEIKQADAAGEFEE